MFFAPNALKFLVISNLGLVRLIIWSSFGYVTFKEFYLYAQEDPKAPTSVQPEYIWIGVMCGFLENLIEVKWYKEGQVKFTGYIAPHIVIAWTLLLSVVAARYLQLKFFVNRPQSKDNSIKIFKEKAN